MIVIIDYGVGNIRSLYNALKRLGYSVTVSDKIQDINNGKAIILPGVGAFKGAMNNLNRLNLVDTIIENVHKGKPILGICLGMQLLFEKSYEDGESKGLGLLEGEIIRFSNDIKVPHMGWNNLIPGEKSSIGNDILEDEYVYFVHSYYLKTPNPKDVVFWTNYGADVPAVVQKDNIIGMQFHPEKSGETGIKLLSNFGELII